MFFKKQNKVNHRTHKKAGFSFMKQKERSASKAKKDRKQRTPCSSKVVDTSFVYYEDN